MQEKTKASVRYKLREAIYELNKQTTDDEIQAWIKERYPRTRKKSIQKEITSCTVNDSKRVKFAGNKRTRLCRLGENDFVFRAEGGKLELFNSKKHGSWELSKDDKGLICVREVSRDELIDRLNSLLRKLKAGLGKLSDDYRELCKSCDGQSYGSAQLHFGDVISEYEKCIDDSLPEITSLFEELGVEPMLCSHTCSSRPAVKILHPRKRTSHVVACHPHPYDALKGSLEEIIEHLENPTDEGKAEIATQQLFNTRGRLKTLHKQWARSACIDDDASLYLIERVLVTEKKGGLPSLEDAVMHVSSWIAYGNLVLDGTEEEKMRALVIVAYMDSPKITLPPEIEDWAVKMQIIPPSDKMRCSMRIEEALSRYDSSDSSIAHDETQKTGPDDVQDSKAGHTLPREKEAKKAKPPLTERENLVVEVLKSIPPGKGMIGKAILDKISKDGGPTIGDSELTGRIILNLKKEGYKIKNRKGAGYYFYEMPD